MIYSRTERRKTCTILYTNGLHLYNDKTLGGKKEHIMYIMYYIRGRLDLTVAYHVDNNTKNVLDKF